MSRTARRCRATPRRTIERKGSACCAWCLGDFPVTRVDVDHVRPLAMGGTDTDGNVHVLCHDCHQLKTATEFGTGEGGN